LIFVAIFLFVNQKCGLVEISEIPLVAGPWFSEMGVVAYCHAHFLFMLSHPEVFGLSMVFSFQLSSFSI
jgi:hypothetical protein